MYIVEILCMIRVSRGNRNETRKRKVIEMAKRFPERRLSSVGRLPSDIDGDDDMVRIETVNLSLDERVAVVESLGTLEADEVESGLVAAGHDPSYFAAAYRIVASKNRKARKVIAPAPADSTIYRVRIHDRLANRTETHECSLAHLAALESTPLPYRRGSRDNRPRFTRVGEPVSLGYDAASVIEALGSGSRE